MAKFTGSKGPFLAGKLYCGFCGEYRVNNVGVTVNKRGRLMCVDCGMPLRTRGRHWTKAVIHQEKAKRY